MGKIITWYDRRIAPEQEFEHQIDQYFSQADNVVRNSYNECLNLADNGQTLGFRALMGGGIRVTQ